MFDSLPSYARLTLVLLCVLFLMCVAAWVVRRLGLFGASALAGGKKDLIQVEDVLSLDPKRRLMAVGYGGRHFLILLGHAGEQMIEVTKAQASDAKTSPVEKIPSFETVREPTFELGKSR
ncbi:MAG: hypothetical protein C0514_03860 [Candidatus Puniceispirillum sp.]|nr:hypothetical protein [Candidatus Puniceispirillum sp.]